MDGPLNLSTTPWEQRPTGAAVAALPGRAPLSVFGVLLLAAAAAFLWNVLVLVTILRVRAFLRVPHNLVASMAV